MRKSPVIAQRRRAGRLIIQLTVLQRSHQLGRVIDQMTGGSGRIWPHSR